MTIHHIYCASDNPNAGDGTKGNPFKTLAQIPNIAAASGDIRYVHIKSGSVFNGETFPSGLTNVVGRGAWFDVYGGSVRPVIDASTSAPTWTLDGTFGFYYADLGTNVSSVDAATRLTIGCLFEDGVPMRMELYNSDHAAMAAQLAAGGYANNWVNGRVYMIPSTGTPTSHTYKAATKGYISWMSQAGPFDVPPIGEALKHSGPRLAESPDGRAWNYFMEGLRLVGGKAGAIVISRGLARVNDVEMYGMGGYQWQAYTIPHAGNSSHLGNAVGIVNEARGVIIENCDISQVFDSAISPQTFTSGDYVSDVLIRNNKIRASGMAGVEISLHTTNVGVINVLVEGNYVTRGQDSFAYPLNGGRYRGYVVIYVPTTTTSPLQNIVFRRNTAYDLQDSGSGSSAGSGFAVHGGGHGVEFSDNLSHLCERYGMFIRPLGSRGDGLLAKVRGQVNDGCAAGIYLDGQVTTVTAEVIGGETKNSPIAFQDASIVNTPIVFQDHKFNGTDAVSGSRTAGITSRGGNSSSGDTTGFLHLF